MKGLRDRELCGFHPIDSGNVPTGVVTDLVIEEKWRRLDPARHLAEETIADVEASGLWLGKVITEVTPSGPFWKAEPEDQDYLERYPNGYTCHFPRPRLGFAPSKRIDHGFGISFR